MPSSSKPAPARRNVNHRVLQEVALRYFMEVANAGSVTLLVYTRGGELLRSFSADHGSSGVYEIAWDGCNGEGRRVAAGLYFGRILVDNVGKILKFVILR